MNPGARTEHLTFPARASRALLSVWATLTFVLCVLALTLTGGASAAVTASGPVTISSVTGSIFATDSNKCALNEGPRAMYIGYAFTATSAVSNVNATLNVTGTGFSLAGGQTPTQYIGNLAAGAKRTLFWYVTFPCTNGATADLNVTVANDITGTVVATGGSTYTVDTMISASAGGDPRLIVDVAGAVVGQLISREVTFKVGNIGSNNEAMFEPAGNLDFDASCLQLVSTRITSVTNVAGVTQGVTDSLYFTGVGSGGGQNNQVVVQYDFLYTGICNIPAGQTQVKATPYSYSGSGTQIKYLMSDGVTGGTYFKFDQATNAFTITKTASYSGTTGVSASSGTNVSAPGGGIITYTVTIKNTSPTYPAILTKITDTLPTSPASVIYGNVTGTSAVNASNSMVMPTANTSSSTQPLLVFRPLTSTSYQVAPGGSLVLQYTVTVPSNVGVYTNTASASVYSFNIGTASATVNTAPRADLGVTKALTSPAGPVYVGDTLTYTLTVNNAGPNAATNVAVTDVLPAGMTQANVTGVKLNTTTTITPTYTTNASGQTVMTMPTVQTLATGSANNLVYTITATAPSAGGSITNTASVAGSTGDANPTNDTSSVTTTVNPKADLGIVKTLTSPTSGTIYSGDQLTYTLTASNAGPSAAQTVAVTDTLPVGATQANVVSVKLGVTTITPTYSTNAGGQTVMTMPGVSSLATGSANNLVYTVVITAPTVSVAGSVTNSASVTSATYDPTTPNTSNVVSTVNPRADLSVTKVLTSPTGPVYVGDALTYTVTVTNNGPSAAQSVSVTDALPASMTQASVTSVTLGGAAITPTYTTSGAQTTMTMPNAGTLNSGASLVYTVTVTAPGTPASIVNSASASTTTPDTNTANNSSSVSTTVAAKADLSIVKTLTSPSGTVYAGDALTYTVTVTNNGPSAAQSVSVLDTLPVGVTQSSVTGVTLAGAAVTPTYGTSGSQTTMTMPTVTTLNSGASLTYTVTVTAPSVNASTSVTNTASVSSATADLVSGNNTSSVGTTITPKADLAVTSKSHTPGVFNVNTVVTYTIDVVNNGPSAVTGASVTDVLPAGLTFANAAGDVTCVVTGTGTCGASTYTSATRTLALPLNLTSGATARITVRVTVSGAAGTVIRNTATISVPAGVADLDTTNNSASDAPVTVGSTAAVVSLVKTVRNVTQNFPANGAFSDTSNASGNPLVPIRSGDVMEYCITYSNTGGPASGFLLADPLASLLTFLPDAYGTGLGILWQRSDASGTLLALGTSGTIPADGQALTNVKLNASNNQDDAGYYDATTVSVRLGTITVPGAGNAGSRGRMCFQTTVR
ncbi:beta strand repeat-containing protein [Deinococcus pimensis]|uniref:beta strand repeat-containing protein n=1 Tax=Deinococcus pimensis TaxID=309888 RepID=UPI000482533F|nr:DUF11 domain-containing protein [Deinococcus pimensis]